MNNFGNQILQHAKNETIKKAHSQIRYGHDLTREVKAWPRMQTQFCLQGKAGAEEMIQSGSAQVGGWPGFVRETFARLYTGDQVKKVQTKSEHRWAEELHAMLDELPEWQRMTQRCRGDSYSTSMATTGLGTKLSTQVPKHQHDADEVRRRYELLLEEWNEDVEAAKAEGRQAPSMPQDVQQAARDLQAAQAEAERNASSMDQSAMRQAMRQALAETSDQLDAVDSALRAVGWSDTQAGPGSESAAAVKQAVADRLRQADKLREIMELAGRLKNVMRQAQAAKVRHGCNEITDIESGGDVARLLPSEGALMRHSKGKLVLFRKLLERGALQYHLEGKEPTGRGPVVVCIDDSGSMSGQRDVWAKALALALLEMARKQKRAFAYCTFSTAITHTFVEAKGAKVNPGAVIDALLAHRGGGTSFDPPLSWALDQIDSHERLEDADVIFISDGECSAHNASEHKRRIKKSGARVWGIAIGGAAISSKGEGSMQDFCEKVYPITELRADGSEQEETAARGVLGL